MNDETKDLILSVFEASLEAQLRAVRRLRQGDADAAQPRPRKGLSQVDMAFDILKKARAPLARLRDPGSHPDPVRRHRRSREPGVLPHQESRPPGPLPAPREEHLRPPPGGSMSLLRRVPGHRRRTGAVCFPNSAPSQRAVRQALGSLVCLGRRCLSRIIWTNGGQDRSWSAEYFLHSRCEWEPQAVVSADPEAGLGVLPADGWSASPSTIRACARPAARFRRRSINAIPCRRRFTSI